MMAIKIKVLAKVFMLIKFTNSLVIAKFKEVSSYGIAEDPPWHPCSKYEYFL